MENEDLYRNLVTLLKLFKNRPYHLTKYLIQNGALKEEFLSKIVNSDRLRNLKEDDLNDKIFADINQMNEFFNSLLIFSISILDLESIAICAPRSARHLDNIAPRPLEAPVIIIFFPKNSFSRFKFK